MIQKRLLVALMLIGWFMPMGVYAQEKKEYLSMYEILDISPNADADTLRKTVRSLESILNQKRTGAPKVTFSGWARRVYDFDLPFIQEIYDTLTNNDKRRAYDRQLAQSVNPFFGKSYYAILGVKQIASSDEIKLRCQELRVQYLLAIKNYEEQPQNLYRNLRLLAAKNEFVLVTKACETLQDVDQRNEYNKQLAGKIDDKDIGFIRSTLSGLATNADVLIVDLIGPLLQQIPIPTIAVPLFNQKLAMRNVRFIKFPSGPNVRTGIGFEGEMTFNNFQVTARMYVIRDQQKKLKAALEVSLPKSQKFSDIFPAFKALDVFSMPQEKLILSSFDYYDPDGFQVLTGLNFVASLELSGPLEVLNKIKSKASVFDSVVFRADPVFLQGRIPIDITRAELFINVPLAWGIDFTRIRSLPGSVKNVFKEATVGDMTIQVAAIPSLYLRLDSGIRLILGSQEEPIRLRGFGVLGTTDLAIGGYMPSMLQLYWLALGNAGIQIDWDTRLLPVTAPLGIPFTGIGMHGQIDVGKEGESRASFKVSGGIRITSTDIPDLVLEGTARNIRYADLVRLLAKIVLKTGVLPDSVSLDNIPAMTLEYLHGFVALRDTQIAGRKYKAGFAFDAETYFFNRRTGLHIAIERDTWTISGSGYMSNIDLNVKGKKIFSFTGPEFITKGGQRVEGPAIDFGFSLNKVLGLGKGEVTSPKDIDQTQKGAMQGLLQGRFGVRGIFAVPALDLSQAVDFEWAGWNLRGDFESRYAGFAVGFGASINLKAGERLVNPDPFFKVDENLEKMMPGKSVRVALAENKENIDALIAKIKDQQAIINGLRTANQLDGKQAEDAKKLADRFKGAVDWKKDYTILEKRIKAEVGKSKTDKKTVEKIIGTRLLKEYYKPFITELKQIGVEYNLLLNAHRKEIVDVDKYEKWLSMQLRFSFKGDFARFIAEQASSVSKELKSRSNTLLDNLSTQIEMFGKKAKTLGAETSREIRGTKEIIAEIQGKIDRLRRARDQARTRIERAGITAQIIAQQTAQKVHQAYLEVLLKPAQKTKAAQRVGEAVSKAAEFAVKRAQDMKKVVSAVLSTTEKISNAIAKGLTIFEIQQAAGQFSSEDLLDGKLPEITRLVAQTNIPGIPNVRVDLSGLAFDFKNPIGSGKNIAMQLIKGIKLTMPDGGDFSIGTVLP